MQGGTERLVASAAAQPSLLVERRGLGIALRIGAMTLFAAMMAALKYGASHGVGAVELLFYRNLFAFPTILAWIFFSGGFAIVHSRRPQLHATRSALGLGVMALTFLALAKLPLAEATVISFSSPLFATILSALMLREKVMWHRWSAIALGFVGVMIVVQPGQSALPIDGMLIGLAAAFGAALVVITLRQIGGTEHPVATVFWFNLACIVATVIPMPFFFHDHPPAVWIALISGGLLGGVAQILMTSALRYAPVSVLMPFDYLQIIWATIWGFFLFDVLPTRNSMIGATLIVGAGCYVVYRERKAGKMPAPTPEKL